MKQFIHSMMFIVIIILCLCGCGTTTLQTQAKMTRSISLNPDQLKEKSVYIRVTGTDASKIELEAPLKKALQDRGVRIVDNADNARFYLHVNTLFADNLKEAERLDVALLGGVAAGVISTVNHSGGDSLLIGVGVALAIGVADRALADETYKAVISVHLKEKIGEEGRTTWDNAKTRNIHILQNAADLTLSEGYRYFSFERPIELSNFDGNMINTAKEFIDKCTPSEAQILDIGNSRCGLNGTTVKASVLFVAFKEAPKTILSYDAKEVKAYLQDNKLYREDSYEINEAEVGKLFPKQIQLPQKK